MIFLMLVHFAVATPDCGMLPDSSLLHDLLSIVKGFRNGIVYGAKIRLPHAFVMTFLFQNGR